jgi:hypothetical protein
VTDRRAFELFDELVELAQIAREDAALAQAVRRMLAADASTSGVLDGALADALPSEVAPADRSGQAVGAYRLVERIGRGGMGEVYRAERQDAGYAQTVAMCQGDHWRSNDRGGRDRVTNSALSRILRKPNSYQSISDFMLNTTRSLYLDGNAYALALRNDRFEVAELHLMNPPLERINSIKRK